MSTKKTATKAIDTSSDFKTVKGLDLREQEALDSIKKLTGFEVQKNIWKSSYWGSKTIGAANYLGVYKGKPAVLKIQGAKPALSEIDVLDAFEKQNQSNKVRTAKLYDFIRWSDEQQFEVLIMEYIDGPKIIQSKKPTTKEEINEFLDFYQEYRSNCRSTPWLDKPTKLPDFTTLLERWSKAREEIYPNHPHRLSTDDNLIKVAAEILKKEITVEKLEFVHGHLSAEDIFKTNDNQYVIFSNLFWGWKHPFYDMVFAQHWLIYNLAQHPKVSRELIEDQRKLWIGTMQSESYVKQDLQAFKIALLERATAGLILDSFAYLDPKNPISLDLVESTRDQVKSLISELL